MDYLVEILINLTSVILDHAGACLAALQGGEFLACGGGFLPGGEEFLSSGEIFLPGTGEILAGAGGIVALAVAPVVVGGEIDEGLQARLRWWYGGLGERQDAANNFVSMVLAHPEWTRADYAFPLLLDKYNALVLWMQKYTTVTASLQYRVERDALLDEVVGLCTLQGRIWAYDLCMKRVMTVDDVHLLGFLLPGETGGHHARHEPTDALAHCVVHTRGGNFIRVAIDNAPGKLAARGKNKWPAGVRNVLIVITSADGTEVYRGMSTRLYNVIEMPAGSHGKAFVLSAAFLKHVNDQPCFGPGAVFSMPLDTADMIAGLGR